MNEYQDIAASGVVIGWVQMVKKMIPESWHKYSPLGAIALGLIYALSMRGSSSLASAIVSGLSVGLTAAGTFAGVKAVAGK